MRFSIFLTCLMVSFGLHAQTDFGCQNVDSGGIIGHDQGMCGPFDVELFESIISPSGGTGNIEYIWLMGECGLPQWQWTVIPSAQDEIYDHGFISSTTCFVRMARRAGCVEYVPSNFVTIGKSYPSSISANGGHVLCQDNWVTLQAFPSSAYEWSTGDTTQEIQVEMPGLYWMVDACGDTSNVIEIEQSQMESPTITETEQCQFAIVNFDTTFNYLWVVDDTLSVAFDLQTFDASQSGAYSVIATDSNNCTIQSNDLICDNANPVSDFFQETPTIEHNQSNGRVMFIYPKIEKGCFSIYGADGRKFHEEFFRHNGQSKYFQVPQLRTGLCVIQIVIGGHMVSKLIVN